jgi:hypothetical protein
MARQNINIGTSANDGTGDPLRTAFGKVNGNFIELYGAGYITASSLPTAVSELTNDTGFITANSLPTALSELTNDTGFITANEAEFITANSLPTALSELTNDTGFITANSLPTAVSELSNDTGFITANTGYIILNDRYTLGTPVSFSNQLNTSLQDEIGPGLAIKRDPGAGGIYNPYQEVGYDQTNRDSPLGTEWNYEGNGFGNLDTVKNRYYTTFSEALKHQIGRNIIGAGLVMHDTINDKYYKFEFTHWGQQGAGTFAYTRTEIIISNVGVEFPDGSIQPTAWTGYLNRYNKVHVGPYSGHVLSADEAGSVIYFFNTHVILPNNEENACPIGSFYTLVVGNTASSLRLKKYANTATIATVESAIEPNLNVGPFLDTDYPLDPYSVAHLIKIEKNKWSLVPAGIQTTITGEVFATSLTANSVISDVVPAEDNAYDLGSPTNQWRSLYVSANTIFIGGTPISVDAGGNLLVDGSSVLIGTVDWENVVNTPNTVSYFANDAGYLTSETDTLDDVVGRNANTSISITVGGLTSTGILKIDDGVHEKFQALADATGTVTHDCSSGHIFYHTSPDANWTVNLTNLNLNSGYATTVTIVIVQGGTGYYPSALEIGGSAQTINWQGNSTPTPSTNRADVVSFSIINNGGTYTVLGQLTGF